MSKSDDLDTSICPKRRAKYSLSKEPSKNWRVNSTTKAAIPDIARSRAVITSARATRWSRLAVSDFSSANALSFASLAAMSTLGWRTVLLPPRRVAVPPSVAALSSEPAGLDPDPVPDLDPPSPKWQMCVPETTTIIPLTAQQSPFRTCPFSLRTPESEGRPDLFRNFFALSFVPFSRTKSVQSLWCPSLDSERVANAYK